MRPMLAIAIICTIVATSASRTAQPPSPQAAVAAEASQERVQASGGGIGATEIDLVKWGFTQGGLTLVLIVVLASYRRDFFRKLEAKQSEVEILREEKRMLAAVIGKAGDAMLRQAVSVQANTEATKLLAQNVNNLAGRGGHHR